MEWAWGDTLDIARARSVGEIKAAIPFPAMPEFTIEQLGSLIPPAVTIALLGAIESLLCALSWSGHISCTSAPLK